MTTGFLTDKMRRKLYQNQKYLLARKIVDDQ